MTLELTAMPAQDSAADLAALVLRARAGAQDAFAELYRRFARSVHGILLSRLPASEVEEAVQETFVAAFQRVGQLRDAAAFGAWIHAAARNHATDRLRARGRRPREEALFEESAWRPSGGGQGELRERVMAHIRSLPEAYRETLTFRLVEGLTGPQIAELTGLTPASVRVNLCRGMDLLRELLKKEGWP